jgi:2-oxo-4-hydroxy-4-carboxy-5-ureidoimidazoline decarboxylase
MNQVLNAWNATDKDAAVATLLSSCAASRWAAAVSALRPFANENDLFDASDRVWATMKEPDWIEAFRAHPRIGERNVEQATAQSKQWSSEEQASVDAAHSDTLAQLASGNQRYEELFGFTYIICATGKSAEEMLTILQRRLASNRQTELREAAEQQRQITQIRLRKWLQP